MKLTRAFLRSILRYEPETGHWYRVVKRSNQPAGARAGAKGPKGYNVVKVNGVNYRSGRLAWFYMTGKWPKHQVDHENRINNDDRWGNLRDLTNLQNARNRSYKIGASGHRGVRIHKKRFTAGIYDKDGTTIYLGVFDKKEQAAEAWHRAYQQLFGPPDYSAISDYVQGAMSCAA